MANEVKQMSPRKRRGLERHLEGWQLAVVAVGIAGVAALLAVPRPVPPDTLPLPRTDPQNLARIAREEAGHADQARRSPLSFETRAAGEAFRSHGQAAARGDNDEAIQALREFRGLVDRVRGRGGEVEVLRLRAIQTELFVDALSRFERGESADKELAELAGNFLEKAQKAGWLGKDRRFALSSVERHTLFRLRWTELAGLRDERAFAPSLDEWKVYYGFLLRHPELGPAAQEDRLTYIAALQRVDLDYPVLLARGVVLYRMGRYGLSEQALRAHIVKHPSGRWRLRAQNYLAAAVEKLRDTTPIAR